jgi:hypothetical protein
MGPELAQRLRSCATSRTVPGSIPGGVTGFFSDISPSDRTMALGLTQPLAKTSTRNIPGGKGGRCVRLTTSPPSRAECHEIWEHKPPGTLWSKPGLLRDCFTFIFYERHTRISLTNTRHSSVHYSGYDLYLRNGFTGPIAATACLLGLWFRISPRA